jgi:hypothetical protein
VAGFSTIYGSIIFYLFHNKLFYVQMITLSTIQFLYIFFVNFDYELLAFLDIVKTGPVTGNSVEHESRSGKHENGSRHPLDIVNNVSFNSRIHIYYKQNVIL